MELHDSERTATGFPAQIPETLTRRTGRMTRKRKRRSSVVEIGHGPSRVKIYTVNRKDGYPMFSLYWKEGGQRKVRHLACMEEARLIAQQITVRLTNGWSGNDEATKRDIELLRHCEGTAKRFGVTLTAAMDEWASARKTAGEIPIADAVRFYAASRADLIAVRTIAQVADEFLESRSASGVSDVYGWQAMLKIDPFPSRQPRRLGCLSHHSQNVRVQPIKGIRITGRVAK
jgi:hypothetical protein